MPKVTLQQQWDGLMAMLHQREREYVESVLGTLPEFIYHVNIDGSVTERTIIRSENATCKIYYYGKKPTRDDVVRLKSYTTHPINFNREKIIFHWKNQEIIGKTPCLVSGSTWLPQLEEETWDFLAKDKAEVRAAEVKAKTQRDKELLASGHIKCRYCGEIRPPEQIHYKSIISRMYRNLRSEPRPYCNDKGCAGYAQMANEG